MIDKKIELTKDNVYNIFYDCLINNNEECDYKEVEVISSIFRFNKDKLKQYKNDIFNLIEQLPDMESGIAFMNLYLKKDSTKWGSLVDAEYLLALGLATENLVYFLPKEMWPMLPFGMPLILRNQKENIKEYTK